MSSKKNIVPEAREALDRFKMEATHILISEYIYIYFYNNEKIQLKTKLTSLGKRSQYVA